MRVLLVGNTGYITKEFVQEAFPESEVFIMGNSLLKTERKKHLIVRPFPKRDEELEDIFRIPRRVVAVNPPEVVLIIGVNGVGKTTTIAKLAYRARMQGKKVLLAAADTFRAAAVEQLGIWAERTGSGFHSKGQDADPAAVAWEAMDVAIRDQYDILFIDTAGRLHNKINLMNEPVSYTHLRAHET